MGINPHDVTFSHCPVCGEELQSRKLKDGEPPRLVCSVCDFVFYLDPKVVACAIVEVDGKIVLLKRGIDPQKGKWVIPGGYVDRGEEVEGAAVRETEEECGLRIRVENLLGVYSYPGYVPVVIVYVAGYVDGTLKPKDETTEATWFKENDIPWEDLAFRSTVDALGDYYKNRKRGNDV